MTSDREQDANNQYLRYGGEHHRFPNREQDKMHYPNQPAGSDNQLVISPPMDIDQYEQYL